MAALRLEDPDAARRHLRAAVRLGERSGSAEVAADARAGLALALNHRGQSRAALRQIEAALTGLTGPARAPAQAQRGAILSLLGRIDEALPDYHAALATLRRHGDPVWVEKLLANRAVIYGYRQEFTAAENDLREAKQLCVKYDLHLPLGYAHQNLGWVSGLRGDVPAALHYFEQAEQRLREHGVPVAELLADRAELLLSVRLQVAAAPGAGPGPSVGAVERAADELSAAGWARLALQARLLAGQLALSRGWPSRAEAQFTAAAVPAGPVVVAAGPGLPGAEREAAAVAALHRVTPRQGLAATVDAVATALDGAGVVHLAAHGRVHPSNPLFTSLTFTDGPLTVYDVERLRQPPQVVVLAACDVGRSAVQAGDELIGLSATFLALGTSQVVASVIPVPDAETVPLMVAFHRRLAAGTPTVPALAAAQAELGAGAPEAMAAAAGFVSIGRAPATGEFVN